MNLDNLNNLIELFANQANKQNKKDIFLEWLNPSNKKTYTWEQTEKNIPEKETHQKSAKSP